MNNVNNQKYVIAVVDDDPGVASIYEDELLSTYLNSRGLSQVFEVLTFNEINDFFLPFYKENKERLKAVLFDGRLPQKKGWEILKEIREDNWLGAALYIGSTQLPQEYCHLFNGICCKEIGDVVFQLGREPERIAVISLNYLMIKHVLDSFISPG